MQGKVVEKVKTINQYYMMEDIELVPESGVDEL